MNEHPANIPAAEEAFKAYPIDLEAPPSTASLSVSDSAQRTYQIAMLAFALLLVISAV